MKMLMRAGLPAFLVCVITSCGVLGPQKAQVKEQQGCSRGTFDFGTWTELQPLGSSPRLHEKMLEAHNSMQTIAMVDLTRAAGWSDDWDRMVVVGEHTEQGDLNSRAQTPDYCWKNLPPTSPMSDRASDRFYLFVRDNRPVQFVQYRASETPIEMPKGAAATKETVLVFSGSYLWPQ